jgi:thiamine biosynthesis lipoprotein
MKKNYIVLLLILLYSCNGFHNLKSVKFNGLAQGTFYSVTYYEKNGTNYKTQIDSILKSFDKSVSIYDSISLISKINKNDTTVVLDNYFIEIFNTAEQISKKTNGAFDITVASLVNAWGFGFKNKSEIDSSLIDSLLEFTGYKLVSINKNKIIKKDSRTILDFNAIAKGYSVDIIGKFLESKGIENYLIDIGGEVFAKGEKTNNKKWKIGIEKPAKTKFDKQKIKAEIKLENKAVATSGNYRNYYKNNGERYSHIINPKTGYPVKNNLMSASVFADNCFTADAYATAFMVMGLKRTKKFLSKNKELEAYLIYSDKNGDINIYTTKGIKNIMSEKK